MARSLVVLGLAVPSERRDRRHESRCNSKLKNGRGESRPTIPNSRKLLVEQLLTGSTLRATWSEAVAMSGWKPPARKPRARFNGTTFAVRRWGFRTAGEVCGAVGISDSTFRRWEGVHFPRMPVVGGIRAIRESEFDDYVDVCRRAYLAAPRTRNKARVARAGSSAADLP